jgi:single-strand DNA-binding protein
MMNVSILQGRLVAEPEMKYTPNGVAVLNFSLAVNRTFTKEGQPDVDFIDCVAWQKTAEVMANHLTKGRQINIQGRLQKRNYDAQDGTKRYVTEVVVERMHFLPDGRPGSQTPVTVPDDADVTNFPDDLPF